MAHESFEDEQIAAVMNALFVNVKVDREERPDVDRIYQLAQQLLTQRSGGWPLTMFLDPESRRPFFGGTYFPAVARHGLPAFPDLLRSVAGYYAEQKAQIAEQGERLVQVFAGLEPQATSRSATLDAAPLAAFRERMAKTFDADYGGFGSAPKFPHPATLGRLLRHWQQTAGDDRPDVDALYMAALTLKRMAEGGIFDHVGGGFCRYAVDRYWQIPHFEKMLYDNGPLLALYAELATATGDAQFASVASRTADWLLTDMQADNGGFFAARDADSEGVEGRYYVWRPDDVRNLVSADDYALAASYWGLDQAANFEGDWHLCVRRPLDEVARAAGVGEDDILAAIERVRSELAVARAERVPPLRDEKQLAAWNALAIRGFAIAGRHLGRPDLVDAATAAVDFVREHLFADGRLLAAWKDGRARFPAYLDDYVFMIDALLELLQARWRSADLGFACTLADAVLEHFSDADNGGFFFTADDHEKLIHRPKPFADEALPAGNGIAARALQRLGFLLGDTRYVDAAEATLRAGWQGLSEFPHGHVSLLEALDDYLHHPVIVVIRGERDALVDWQTGANALYSPGRLVFAIPDDAADLPGALADRRAGDTTIAYRCTGTHCDAPTTDIAAALQT